MRVVRWDTTTTEAISDAVKRQIVWGTQGTLARFSIRKGTHLLTHQHPSEQFTCVLAGALKLRANGEDFVLETGDMLVIPPDREHEAWVLEDVTMVNYFAPPREDWREGKNDYLKGERP